MILSKNSKRLFSVISDTMEDKIGIKGVKNLINTVKFNDKRYFENEKFQINKLLKDE